MFHFCLIFIYIPFYVTHICIFIYSYLILYFLLRICNSVFYSHVPFVFYHYIYVLFILLFSSFNLYSIVILYQPSSSILLYVFYF